MLSRKFVGLDLAGSATPQVGRQLASRLGARTAPLVPQHDPQSLQVTHSNQHVSPETRVPHPAWNDLPHQEQTSVSAAGRSSLLWQLVRPDLPAMEEAASFMSARSTVISSGGAELSDRQGGSEHYDILVLDASIKQGLASVRSLARAGPRVAAAEGGRFVKSSSCHHRGRAIRPFDLRASECAWH